ncbi:uncharacterized protein RHO25_002134 [Cercospora beticola]|uniref:Uncharacterized protein n=1 Tax=Cercospora beticola TaxID=122368 RepID=A0ABZ0NDE2_CERBT|nr:hypothetical protein RHO25_002134 [Cercospora beticola]
MTAPAARAASEASILSFIGSSVYQGRLGVVTAEDVDQEAPYQESKTPNLDFPNHVLSKGHPGGAANGRRMKLAHWRKRAHPRPDGKGKMQDRDLHTANTVVGTTGGSSLCTELLNLPS